MVTVNFLRAILHFQIAFVNPPNKVSTNGMRLLAARLTQLHSKEILYLFYYLFGIINIYFCIFCQINSNKLLIV